MTYSGILPTWAHRPTITSCDTCGAEVASDHHDLHDTWHNLSRAEAEAIQRVLDFDRRMQP